MFEFRKIENNKNMKREEREKHSRMRKTPQAIRRWKNLPSYLSFPPPQTPVLIALLPFRHDPHPFKGHHQRGPGMTPRENKRVFTVLPNAKGEGWVLGGECCDVVVCRDEEREIQVIMIWSMRCAEMGESKGGKSKHRDSTHPVMSLAYCIALPCVPAVLRHPASPQKKREHQSI